MRAAAPPELERLLAVDARALAGRLRACAYNDLEVLQARAPPPCGPRGRCGERRAARPAVCSATRGGAKRTREHWPARRLVCSAKRRQAPAGSQAARRAPAAPERRGAQEDVAAAVRAAAEAAAASPGLDLRRGKLLAMADAFAGAVGRALEAAAADVLGAEAAAAAAAEAAAAAAAAAVVVRLPESILANREPYLQGDWRKEPYIPRRAMGLGQGREPTHAAGGAGAPHTAPAGLCRVSSASVTWGGESWLLNTVAAHAQACMAPGGAGEQRPARSWPARAPGAPGQGRPAQGAEGGCCTGALPGCPHAPAGGARRPYVRLKAYELNENREVLAWKFTTRKRGQCSGEHCTRPGHLGTYRCARPARRPARACARSGRAEPRWRWRRAWRRAPRAAAACLESVQPRACVGAVSAADCAPGVPRAAPARAGRQGVQGS